MMPKPDASQRALRQVERMTDSKPVRGETLLRSRKLKRQLSEAKKRLAAESAPRTDRLGVYNFVRRHNTLKTTPAVAAGVELEQWGLEDVVEMTVAYQRRKQDAEFEKAFAEAGL